MLRLYSTGSCRAFSWPGLPTDVSLAQDWVTNCTVMNILRISLHRWRSPGVVPLHVSDGVWGFVLDVYMFGVEPLAGWVLQALHTAHWIMLKSGDDTHCDEAKWP